MNKYIMMFVAAIALVSCSDDVLETPSSPVKAGAEVQFGLSLEGTRTIYGEEANNAFPIYWVDGDKVQIYSPECLQGRNNAEYKVSVAKANQAYADGLTPTGANGVQWGNDETKTANFYSFYPSGAYHLDPNDNKQITGVNISTVQTVEYRGTANGKDIIKSDMQDCLMYASAEGVAYGATVNLQYKPITTVLMLNLSVDDASDVETFNVSKITLTAPSGIVGTFNVDLETGKFVKFADETGIKSVETNIIDSETGGFYTITKGKDFEVPVFIAPDQNVKLEGWKIEVLANNLTFTKTIKAGEITYGNGNTGLVAGKIHRITLPGLKVENTDPGVTDEWLVANWMKNIPRNVYLSEVSLPGSWNSVNTDSQGSTAKYVDIATQYSKGVRAFHFDTRWKRTGSRNNYVYTTLGIANAGHTDNVGGLSSDKVMTDDNCPTVKEVLDAITSKLNSEEYMVAIFTFAQDSYVSADAEGRDWFGVISNYCATNDAVYDAKKLSQNTVIGEVLNKLIVIINFDGAIGEIPQNSKCLFLDNFPMEVKSSSFTAELNDNNVGPIYKANATTAIASGLTMYRTQSQIAYNADAYTDSRSREDVDSRGFLPTRLERKTVAENILNWSKNNYGKDSYAHDKWIYLGLGGYYMKYSSGGVFGIGAGWKETGNNAHKDVASYFNTWINGKVTEMGTTPEGQTAKVPYYPVGIVLMNYVNDYASVVKNILLLNNKYQLQFDPNKPTKTEDYLLQQADYDGSLTNGGNAIK